MSGKLTKQFERGSGGGETSDSDRILLMNQAMDNKSFDESECRVTQVIKVDNHGNQKCDLESVLSESSSNSNQSSNSQESVEDPKEDEILKYGAKHVIMLFTPVSLCMALVVTIISSIDFYTQKGLYFIYTPFEREGPVPLDTGSKIWQSLANTVILLSVVIFMTIILLLLYKARCYKIIAGWLFLSSLTLLFIFSFVFLGELLRLFNYPLDFITVGVIIWNFGVVGIICIHWMGPLLLQQAYLLVISALVALTFIKYLPDWTTWVLLGAISIWDLVAVLTPKGPLRRLVELAHERNEPIFPALIYSTTMAWVINEIEMEDETGASPESGDQDNQDEITGINENVDEGGDGGSVPVEDISTGDNLNVHNEQEDQDNDWANQETLGYITKMASEVADAEESVQGPQNESIKKKKKKKKKEDSGVKLGLGDFIFYSVLVGKASTTGDWNTTVACFIAILIGLCFTLLLLAIFRKALPALPISITFGLIFYFATSQLVQPFMTMCTYNQIFI